MSKKVLKQVMNYILVVLGTFLLSFGAVIFLTECELVSLQITFMTILLLV